MSGSVPAVLRQFLLRPGAFFEERPPASTLPVAAGLVVLASIATVGMLFLLGSMLAGTVDGTVTVDNPNRPPDFACDGDSTVEMSGCDEPKTIERDAGALVQEAVREFVGVAFVAPLLLWLLGTGTLYVAARVLGGSPSLAGSGALAGWAALPELFRIGAVLLTFRLALSDITVTDPEQAPAVIRAAIETIDPVLLVISLVVAGWQWWLLTGGMVHDADLSRGAAAVATGVPLLVAFLLTL